MTALRFRVLGLLAAVTVVTVVATVDGMSRTPATTSGDGFVPTQLYVGDASTVRARTGSTSLRFPITLSSPRSGDVYVHWATADGTATAGQDYATGSGTLRIRAGSVTASVSVAILSGNAANATETFTVNAVAVVPSEIVLARASGTGTLLNDTTSVASLALGDVAAVRPASSSLTAMVPITLTRPQSVPVSVTWSTLDGTAVAGTDYARAASITTTIPANATRAFAGVPISSNSDDTPSRSFQVRIVARSPALNFARQTATVTIMPRGYDTPTQLYVGDASTVRARTGSTSLRFPITLSSPRSGDVYVHWATADGTATAGQDYATGTGTLRIRAGSVTASVSVAILSGNAANATETFTVNAVAVVPSEIVLARASGTGTLLNDTTSVASLALGDVAAVRPASSSLTAMVPITLTRPQSVPVSVTWSTLDGTAVAGTDYARRASITTTIPANATRAFAGVPISSNSDDTPSRSFQVRIVARSPALNFARQTATVTIMPRGLTSAAPATNPAAFDGFVQVSGTSLVDNGQPFRFDGVNDYNVNSNGGCVPASDLAPDLAYMPAHATVRAYFFQNWATANGARDWSRFDATIAAAASHHAKIVAVLSNEWNYCDGPAKYLPWWQVGYASTINAGELVPYRTWVEEIVRRYANNPAIAVWDLVNEGEARNANGSCSEAIATSALRAFSDDVGGLVHGIDPNHIVTVGSISGECGTNEGDYQSVYASPGVDLCDYHDYRYPTSPMGNTDPYNGLAASIARCHAIGKPLAVLELGIHWTKLAPATLANRAQLFDQKFAAQIAGGSVGNLLWDYSSPASSIHDYEVGPNDPSLGVLKLYQLG